MKKLPAESSHNFLVLIPCKQQVHYAPTDSRTRKIGFSANSFTTVLLVVGGLALAGNIITSRSLSPKMALTMPHLRSSLATAYADRRKLRIGLASLSID